MAGEKKKHPIVIALVFIFIVIPLISFVVVSVIPDKNKNTENKSQSVATQNAPQPVEEKKSQFDSVGNAELTTANSIAYVTGKVKNVSGKDFKFVEIKFSLFDKEGSIVGYATANIDSVPADSIWKYQATCFDASARPVRFEFKEMTAY